MVSTKVGDWLTIIRWGRSRWAIEGFFKAMKGRFGLDQFGQRTLLGTIRFLLLAFLAFILTNISRVDKTMLPDWKSLALEIQKSLFALLEWGVLEREGFELEPYLRLSFIQLFLRLTPSFLFNHFNILPNSSFHLQHFVTNPNGLLPSLNTIRF